MSKKEQPIEEIPHHRFGPSALASYEVCEGFLPKQDDPHPLTIAGSRMHDATEHDDYSRLRDEVEAELVKKVQQYEAKIIPPGGKVYREERVEFYCTGLDEVPFGTFDHFVWYPNDNHGIMVDYKYGFHPVADPEDNIQMQAYALGLFQQFPEMETLRVYILQPRIDWVGYADYTRDDMVWVERRITRTIKAAKNPQEENFRSSYWNCLYCARKADCPLINHLADQIVTKYDPDLEPIEDADTVRGSEVKDPDLMSKLMDRAAVLSDWAENIKFHAKELAITAGEEIPGYTQVTRNGKRTITVPSLAMDVATEELDVPLRDFVDACKPTVSTVERLVKDACTHGTKKDAVAKFYDRLRDLDAIEVSNPSTFLKKKHLRKNEQE